MSSQIQQQSKTTKGGHQSNRSHRGVLTTCNTKGKMKPIIPFHQRSRRLEEIWFHKLPTNDETATSYATTKHNDDDEVAASDSKAKPKTWAPCNKHVGRAGGAHTV
jgi:hypothetical protein